MSQPSPIDRAIAQCDRILENIDRIQTEMRQATDAALAAINDAIAKLKEPRRV